MEKLVIWGASGHASVVADIVGLCGMYEIVGFIVDGPPEDSARQRCSPILGGIEQIDNVRAAGISRLIVGVGDCADRVRLAEVAKKKGFALITAIHPRATVAGGVQVGQGTLMAAGTVVNSGAVIGENVILNTSASIDHDCIIEDGAHVGPGCHLGGRVRIGAQTWLGIGTIVRDRITIGPRAIVGAGAVVVEDLPPDVVAYGVPAKVVRSAR